MKQVRIDKFLSDNTTMSRKTIKSKISKNLVKVNGKIITKVVNISLQNDVVEVEDQKIENQQFQYYMFHKPEGVISANNDYRSATIFDLVNLKSSKYFTFGRLDKDTEGLVIISNDGQMSHKLLSPKNHISKKYFVRVNKELSEDVFEKTNPIVINDEFIVEKYCFEKVDSHSCFLTIYEGKFHQVKRMFGALGYSVQYLKRVQFGKLKLDPSLAKGQIRKLTKEEIELMQQSE
ncbi:16S rRNA pseudouridine synthase [Mycoplasmopsis californica]|uniref:Pseudouridine synthase n=1 Tax=Mycoplasmopsis equigenitalium TaxID=114883 RepID=A0ABY5J4Z5_9BACT|nr:pseudouridine synthase [Mycoplasmopsis equigenitalium]UUD36773.1 rRNA pseudouridine synthase [Mycoplasmopsis equigenitalium]VEU69929.1 16S rRNA pseudouridine synthase [Mycoplasmopsis californica]